VYIRGAFRGLTHVPRSLSLSREAYHIAQLA
jgi:hypothetical protein